MCAGRRDRSKMLHTARRFGLLTKTWSIGKIGSLCDQQSNDGRRCVLPSDKLSVHIGYALLLRGR